MGENETPIGKLTFKLYSDSFTKQLSGIAAIAVGLVGAFLPDSIVATFPPLGDAGVPARAGVFLVALLVIYVAYFAKDFTLAKIRVIRNSALVLVILLLCAYVALHMRFVRKVEIANRDPVSLSVGYQRTPFAQDTFGQVSDWELLRARGLQEENVNELWTWPSILIARSALFLSYCGLVAASILMFSLGVIDQLKRSHANQ